MSRLRKRLLLASFAVAATALATLAAPTASGAFGWWPSPAPTPNCGSTIYKADGSKWTCTFDDEFSNGYLDPNKWTVQQTATSGYTTGPVGANVCYVNNTKNVNVSGGYLTLTVRKEAAAFSCGGYSTQYSGGTVSGYGKFSQTYGRFEVRAKVPASVIAGLQESFWLWPVNSSKYGPEPTSGEIDFAELYSVLPNLAVPYVHYTPAAPDPNVTSYKCTINDPSQFHTYALEWTPTTLKMIYDGTTCLVDTWKAASPLSGSAPFDQPFFLVLTQALGFGPTNNYVDGTTPLPATTTVDYVHIWK